MSRLSFLMLWTALGALVLAPAAATAQSAGQPGKTPGYSRLQGGQWEDTRPLSAARQIAEPAAPQAAPTANVSKRFDLEQAQAPAAPPRGQVRVQGRPLPEPEIVIPVPSGLQTELRQQMRDFLQSITTYARRQKPNFSILLRGGLELLIKRDLADETQYSPSRAFIRSIDGVIVDGLFYGKKVFGEPTPRESQLAKARLAKIAQSNGLSVLVVDYGADKKTVDDSHRLNKQKGFISIAVHAPLVELSSLPPYPRRPFSENPLSIRSLDKVSNFAFIANSAAFGRQDEFAMKMHGTNYDLLIIDVFHGRKPLSRQAVETLKFKKLGARRLVFATANVGSAASYRYYWKPQWQEGSPTWISAPVRDDPDSYFVEFWRPEWQRLISGDTQSYIYGIIRQGFDGVVLEGIEEAYRFFERGSQEPEEAPTPAAPAPAAPAAAQGPAGTPPPPQ
ncbi:MAG: hypothetical protein V3U48_08165 [Rhodospirillales bacterium]